MVLLGSGYAERPSYVEIVSTAELGVVEGT